MTTAEKIFKEFDKAAKLAKLAERGATQGERQAAQNALERVSPEYIRISAMSDEELLAAVGG